MTDTIPAPPDSETTGTHHEVPENPHVEFEKSGVMKELFDKLDKMQAYACEDREATEKRLSAIEKSSGLAARNSGFLKYSLELYQKRVDTHLAVLDNKTNGTREELREVVDELKDVHAQVDTLNARVRVLESIIADWDGTQK